MSRADAARKTVWDEVLKRHITPLQSRVLKLSREGLNTNEIAGRLNVHSAYVRSCSARLGVSIKHVPTPHSSPRKLYQMSLDILATLRAIPDDKQITFKQVLEARGLVSTIYSTQYSCVRSQLTRLQERQYIGHIRSKNGYLYYRTEAGRAYLLALEAQTKDPPV